MREHVSLYDTVLEYGTVSVCTVCVGAQQYSSTVRLPRAQAQHGGSRVRKVGGRRETEMSDVE